MTILAAAEHTIARKVFLHATTILPVQVGAQGFHTYAGDDRTMRKSLNPA